jgi:hypothetical protein
MPLLLIIIIFLILATLRFLLELYKRGNYRIYIKENNKGNNNK